MVVGQAGFDFSIVGMISAGAVILAQTAVAFDGSLTAGLLVSLGVLVAAGTVNGLAVAYFGIAPIVATMAMNALLLGAVLAIGNSIPVAAPTALTQVAVGTFLGVPTICWLAIVVIGGLAVMARRTTFGRRLLLVGSGPRVSAVDGLRSRRVVATAYLLAALCCWVTAVALAGFVGNPNKNLGDPYLLSSICAVVLGGASLAGGRMLLVRTAVGATFWVMLAQLMSVLGASAGVQYTQQALVVGIAVLAAAPKLSGALTGRIRTLRRTRESDDGPQTSLPQRYESRRERNEWICSIPSILDDCVCPTASSWRR